MRTLCETCRFKRDIVSGRGSRFLLCERSVSDTRFAKYPPQPLFRCAGFEERPADEARPPEETFP